MSDVRPITSVQSATRTSRAHMLQMLALLELRASDEAIVRLRSQAGEANRLIQLRALGERLCAAVGLSLTNIPPEIFLERFSRLPIRELREASPPTSKYYQIRFLLERSFGLALAYHKKEGLMVITCEEREEIKKGTDDEYTLDCPYAEVVAEEAPLAIKAQEPSGVGGAIVVFVEKLAQEVNWKDYPPAVRQKILRYLKEGNYRNAALLLFGERTSKEVLRFIRKNKVVSLIASAELKQMLGIGAGRKTSARVAAEEGEVVVGFLLCQLEPTGLAASVGAEFITDLARRDEKSAARVLGCLGEAMRTVELKEEAEVIDYTERSLAGFVVTVMVTRELFETENDNLINKIIARGVDDPDWSHVYERVLDELHADFSAAVFTAEAYRLCGKTTLFSKDEQTGGRSATLVAVGRNIYQIGGELLMGPRVFYRNLVRKLFAEREYDAAWEVATCGKKPAEAFFDLQQTLDSRCIGRLLRTRDREEVAKFVRDVVMARMDYSEGIAYVLRDICMTRWKIRLIFLDT